VKKPFWLGSYWGVQALMAIHPGSSERGILAFARKSLGPIRKTARPEIYPQFFEGMNACWPEAKVRVSIRAERVEACPEPVEENEQNACLPPFKVINPNHPG
jgi:hypothetical protein